MSTILRIASKFTVAFGHPTEDAMKKYLRKHPNADPKDHYVDDERGGDDYEEELKAKDKRLLNDFSDLGLVRGKGGELTPAGKVMKAIRNGDKIPPDELKATLADLKRRGDNSDHGEARRTFRDMHKRFEDFARNYESRD